MGNIRLAIIVLILPVILGCGTLSLLLDSINPEREHAAVRKHKEWEAITRGLLQSKYLGANKSDVEHDFGKPTKVVPNVSIKAEPKDSKNEPEIVVSEMWVYQLKESNSGLLGQRLTYVFYFFDDQVIQTLP
jgi:hypothetical protein